MQEIIVIIFVFTMLSAGIIIPDKADNKFIHSLQDIERVEWNFLCSPKGRKFGNLENAMIFSSADILPLVSELLIILDPEYCTFEYLSSAIRNGCHLFLSEKLSLDFQERKELIRLAKEGNTFIQVKNDFLFNSVHESMVSGKNGTCFIEINHSAPLEGLTLEERLLKNLFLVMMATGVPVYRFDVFCGTAPIQCPDIINIHIKFVNGSTASVNLIFTEEQHAHVMKIYQRKGLDIIDLLKNRSIQTTDYEYPLVTEQIRTFIQSIRTQATPIFNLTEELEIYLLMKKIREKFDLYSTIN